VVNIVKRFSLRAARVNSAFTQKEAAQSLGISNKTLCSWENGKTFPDQPMIERICGLYGLTYDMIDFTA
jgi:DNA-binding XRE family transcriptional regulator